MMRAIPFCVSLSAMIVGLQVHSTAADPSSFTRLVPTHPTVIAAAPAFPGGGYNAENILKPPAPNGHRADYASHGLAAKTFIDFDLGRPDRVAAFRHIQRRTPDTIAEANLLFSDTADFQNLLATVKIQHVDEPGATTFAAFAPVTARYVRWQVTSVLPGRSPNVGGQGIEFFAAGPAETRPEGIGIEARTVQVVQRQAGGLVQPLKVTLDYPYAEAAQVVVKIAGQEPRSLELTFGSQTLPYMIVAADAERTLEVAIELDGQRVAARAVPLPPTRKLTVYMLPHSHTDIGYTAIQTDIEEKQINNLLQGLADARRTADYPEGARFVWNVEVLWAADLYLNRLAPQQQDEFCDAVKRGQLALNGMYLNELTGLCRPEELVRLFRYATQLGQRTGVPVDSAMISDVPGYTWGTVTAMAQAGIKYFSVAPNYFDRIGDILVQWENKPFWWIGPDGQSKVLVWIPFWGYAMSHRYGQMSAQLVEDFSDGLAKRGYPYDIACVRWAGHGDNAVPDPIICEFVKEWNATHESPRFVISSTSEAFRAFEKRYGDQLPQVRGDWTPYWEDGAGSSAAETAMNRASSERLAQAETLWALLDPSSYPAKRFEDAWNNVLLYSEHTWGAHCSISQPAIPFTSDQWNIKQSYATAANLQSRQLLSDAAQRGAGFQPVPPVEPAPSGQVARVSHVDVYNTTSWLRTEVVLLPHEVSEVGNFVTDDQGRPVPAQRLVSRELALLVQDLPPLSGRRYAVKREGEPAPGASATAAGTTLSNDKLHVRLDDQTGGIVELRAEGLDANLVDTASGHAVNDYLYLIGDDLAALQRNGPVKITVRDHGPLVASLLVESDAPGCHQLSREIRLVAGADYVQLLNTVDKKRLAAPSYHASEGKESVNFAFPFQVPGGELRLDVPLGVIRPEHDQMPSACKNWLSVGRWADVANRDFGITWVTLDAPLVQVGGITATLLNSQTNPDAWRKKIEPTQKLYCWAMNNHWGTNYRAYQEGPVVFRFVLRPHRGTTAAEASRFATGFSQPLVAVPGRGAAPPNTPLLQLDPADVLVSGLKPSDDGTAIIVRLFGASDQPAVAKLRWSAPAPKEVWLSDTSERPLRELAGDIPIPAWGLVTLRAQWPE
jgi:alpha-mannosidase